MKTLIAAALLVLSAAPVLAMNRYMTGDGVTIETAQPGYDILGRRSGLCREGSRCGGV